MSRIIVKSPYLKPSDKAHLQNYIEYIATRHGVERPEDPRSQLPATSNQLRTIGQLTEKYPDVKELFEYGDYLAAPNRENAGELILAIADSHPELFQSRDGYIQYMAHRPGVQKLSSHGLFTSQDGPLDLQKIKNDIAGYPGNVWTHIVSLRREDAARLGYDRAGEWRELLRRNQIQIAAAMKIRPENFRWYAAFHNESHHPHIHMVAYSTDPKEAYLTKQGIRQIKSVLARDIFRQDLLCLEQEKTQIRDSLRRESRETLQQLMQGGSASPVLEQLMEELAQRLQNTKGKKVYGYLSAGTKKLVDAIVDELGRDQRIAALYDAWYEQQNEIIGTYRKTLPERLPLSQNKEFKAIRNAVVKAAAYPPSEDEDTGLPAEPEPAFDDGDDPAPQNDLPINTAGGGRRSSLWTEAYKEARAALYGNADRPPDPARALELMLAEANRGNPLAQHDLGTMLLKGIGCEKEEARAREWFEKALSGFKQAERKKKKQKGYLQFRIGKMYAMGYGTEQDYLAAASWYERAVEEENPFAAYALGSLYHRGQGVEQEEEKALSLFLQAAQHEKQPNAYAMYELGKMYRKGLGTPPDPQESKRWYQEAYQAFVGIEASRPDDKLQYRLGYMALHGIGTTPNKNTACRYWQKAARLKNQDALYALGKLYLDSSFSGFHLQNALSCLELAVREYRDANAAYLLGRLYSKGELLPKDTAKAIPYLMMAAQQDNPFALYLLGKLYLAGEGLEQDPAKGLSLLERSFALGNQTAAYLLGKTYAKGELVPKDMEKALPYLFSAANAGNQFALYQLGRIYFYGDGVLPDPDLAIQLLNASAAQGNPFALRLLDRISHPSGPNCSAYTLTRAASLLRQVGRIFENRLGYQQEPQLPLVDSKLRQKIAEKMAAHGQKLF